MQAEPGEGLSLPDVAVLEAANQGNSLFAVTLFGKGYFPYIWYVNQEHNLIHMKTIQIEILHDKALDLLRNLEALNLIRLLKQENTISMVEDLPLKYKGKMSRQPLNEVDRQLHDLRNA